MIKLSDSMKNRILNKLRSRTGASISFALLLFLVCAVLSSVIIAAATAAAGRMSKIAETDQRYYAVTSAAEALTDLLDGKTVSIVEVTTTTIETTYTDGVAGTPVPGTTETKTYIVADKKASQISESDYKAADGSDISARLLKTGDSANTAFVDDSIPVDAAKNASEKTALSKELKLTSAFSSAAGLDYDALAVTIKEAVDADGNITLTLFNTYKAKGTESSDSDRYKMILSFGADRSETNSSVTKTKNETLNVVSETSYTVKSEKTDTKITSLTWNLASIKTNTDT